MSASTQQCSVIRVDKKTSLLVYRDSNQPDSILQNANEPSVTSSSFTSTLKSIFSPSSSNIFSASAASARQEAERKKLLGSGAGLARSRSQSAPGSDTLSQSSSNSSVNGSPRLRFAPLPEPDRPRGRSSSISCGVSARAALLRGETGQINPSTARNTELLSAEVMNESAVESEDEEIQPSPQQPQESDDGRCSGRAICRNSTITKENAARHPANTTTNTRDASPVMNTEEEKGKWSNKLRKSFSRRSSSQGSDKSSSAERQQQQQQPTVVYEVVSAEEADRMVEKGGAKRGRSADLKVVPEREEDQWIETTEYAENYPERG